MPSPFPGMDPFLESPKIWPEFQHALIASLYQQMLPSLSDRYRARMGCREYTTELALFTSVVRQEHTEEWIEIRDRNDDQLVTLLDMVSITNRTSSEGRKAYLATRQAALLQRASVVEIDLVTQGKQLLDFSREGLPELDYTIAVTRGHSPDRYEIWHASVSNRLPQFKLPLAGDDRDTLLDLQIAMARAYSHGRLESLVDYDKPLPAEVRLHSSSAAWLEEWLREMKLNS